MQRAPASLCQVGRSESLIDWRPSVSIPDHWAYVNLWDQWRLTVLLTYFPLTLLSAASRHVHLLCKSCLLCNLWACILTGLSHVHRWTYTGFVFTCFVSCTLSSGEWEKLTLDGAASEFSRYHWFFNVNFNPSRLNRGSGEITMSATALGLRYWLILSLVGRRCY